MACDEQPRTVDVLCFTNSKTGKAEVPVDRHEEESGTDSALQPAALQSDAENDEDDVQSIASIEDDDESSTAEQSAALCDMDVDTQSAVRPDESKVITETLDDDAEAEPLEEELDITALEATTSVHDDWLHRVPFFD